MKLHILILLLSLSYINVFAQDIYDTQDSVVYLTAVDEALLLDKEAKLVFKTNPLSLEMKVGKAFSIIPSVDKILIDTRKIGVETRYYHKMARRIEEGKQANNISGPYISTKAEVGFKDSKQRILMLGLNYGFQQRVLNREYFDLGLNLGYSRTPDSSLSSGAINTIGIGTFTRYGFVFGKKQKIDPNSTCSLIKCHNNRKRAWRIGLNNLAGISRLSGYNDTDPFWLFSLSPKIAFEQKIFNSSFSLEQELQGSLRVGFNNFDFIEIPGLNITFRNSFSYIIGSKFYYKMARKILEGAGGNNLSGPYVFARAKHTQFTEDRDGFTHLGIGNQRELFGNIILEYSIYGIIRNYGEKATPITIEEPIGIDFKLSYILN